MKRAVFIDRDGTLNEDTGFLYKAEEFRFIPGSEEAVRLLNEHGFLVIVITNQSGVGRGLYTEADVLKLHRHINESLKKKGAHVDAFYYCPHHPTMGTGKYRKECGCRKPATGMIDRAVDEHGIDRAASWLVGDKDDDVIAGERAGLRTVRVRTGKGASAREGEVPVVGNLLDAARLIIETV